jgi:hypothetical protein
MSPERTSASPSIAARSKDFPDPVGPEITLNAPFGRSIVMSRMTNLFSSSFWDSDGKLTETLLKEIESPGYVFSGFSGFARNLSIRQHRDHTRQILELHKQTDCSESNRRKQIPVNIGIGSQGERSEKHRSKVRCQSHDDCVKVSKSP